MPGYHDPIQHNRRLSSFSLDAIEEYFAQLNPIAKRIAYDINDTKANYGQLWETLDYHEQNDIINDTLIKPEISLRYFDNFLTPTPTNSSGNSYQSSTDSLTAIVLKDVGAARDSMGNREEEGDKKKLSTLKAYGGKFSPHGVKNFYSYDGRNLYTFGMQKVALKVIQDDALGCFRDEHSQTMAARKAIALPSKILTPPIKSTALKSRDESSPQDEESKKALDNYHRLQHQLKMNLNEKKSQDLQKSSSSTYISIKPSSITANRKIIKSPDTSYKLESKENTNSKNAKSSLLQNYLNSTQINATPKIGVNYAVFSDAYNTAEESSNLLQHCGQSDLATASCSSAATSDDDEKTLEAEDVHLLDNDSNIRKGFDFLNNW
ncbi:hypothetical protein CVS40_3195 [Lucilia cuprina]|nr:hypothetical protein CVS40_3195 [Lucilia cuprina]